MVLLAARQTHKKWRTDITEEDISPLEILMRCPGIEPGPSAWKADILTTRPTTQSLLDILSGSQTGTRTRKNTNTQKNWRTWASIPVPLAC